MKKLLLAVFILFTANIANAQVSLTLINKTGRQLDNVSIDKGKYIGRIEKDSLKTTSLAVMETFQGTPIFNVTVQYADKKISTNIESVGITYLQRITNGEYIYNIVIVRDRWDKEQLVLSQTFKMKRKIMANE